MTYIVFLPAVKLCPLLISYYKMLDNSSNLSLENLISNKRKVVHFAKEWCDTAKDAFYEDANITSLMQVGFQNYKGSQT
jgi:hypothetical protein